MRTSRKQYMGGDIDRDDGTLESTYVREVINTDKGGRRELWVRPAGMAEWILFEAQPGIMWVDHFMAQVALVGVGAGVAAAYLASGLTWIVNGRRNGANDPNDTNFDVANDIGGGIEVKIVVGGVADDYVAIHFGDNFPVATTESPHFHTHARLVSSTEVGYLLGLVGSAGKPVANGAWAIPDDGYWFRLDTDAVDGYGDTKLRAIVRSGGVDRVVFDLGIPTFLTKLILAIRVNDSGDGVTFILNGDNVGEWASDLPSVQLQPYYAIVGRAGDAKQLNLYKFRHIQDLV